MYVNKAMEHWLDILTSWSQRGFFFLLSSAENSTEKDASVMTRETQHPFCAFYMEKRPPGTPYSHVDCKGF